ncbi:type II and III secretion system protein family protein [Tsuneonella sp. SYSU-LHT278]|uniref:type II and III secretion system protein family protein n=1 Tax=Tsuneonella sediminis TaxID=3416089 RepID=UPI003F79D6DE
MRTIASALTLALAGVAAAPVMAQSGGIHAGALEVPVNKSQVITVDQPIGKALVGNAEIADVLPITERSVYVLGKQMGTTSLTLYGRDNRVLAVMDVAVGPDVDSLKVQFSQLIPGQPIDARISNDAVILSGTVSDPGAADRAAQIARAYAGDKVINLISVGGSQQVMLEVRFAEVQRNIGEQLGAQGFLDSNGFSGVTGGTAGLTPKDTTVTTDFGGVSTTTTVTEGVLTLGSITDTFGIFRGAFNIAGLSVDGLLNTLERKGMAKTLAEPTLLALSGERASFLAGGEFPVPVIQSGGANGNGNGNAITVEFKPFGVSLGFTPTVLGDKVINLVVEPEVSSIDPSASITINGLVVPGLQTRRAATTVELRDGESFAIAGLLRKDFATTVRQLPILGSIPIIGSLFRSSSFQKGETELLIVVTPHLVAPLRPEQVVLPTDRVKDPRAADTLLLGEDFQQQELAPSAAPSPGGAGPEQPAEDPGYDY